MSKEKKLYLASPRGFCAGVERAIDIVSLALEVYGLPLYVKHAIVHNTHVIDLFEKKGVHFVDSLDDIPNASRVVFSAHGSPLSDFEKAKQKQLHVIDATCPLVTKVHLEVARYDKEGYDIIMIGHRGHVEPYGTLGHASKAKTYLVHNMEEAKTLQVVQSEKIAIVTQTTLSVQETSEILAVLKERFPHAHTPAKEDICYATTNRQQAVVSLLPHIEALIVIGSTTSSNSQRLAELARQAGKASFLLDDIASGKVEDLLAFEAVGLTSGASVPDYLVQEAVNFFSIHKFVVSKDFEQKKESVTFSLPHDFIKAIKKVKPDADVLQKHTIQQGRKMHV